MDLQAPVTSIMSADLRTVHPDDPIVKIDEFFREHRIHHVPVVDGENHVVGIISKSDFLYLIRGYTENETDRFRHQAMLRAFKAKDIMHENVETIYTTDTIKKAVSLLAENRYRCLPILDDEGMIAGIITTHDIIQLVNREA